MIETDGERFTLAIPLCDAVAFAMGWTDLSYSAPDDAMRPIVGLMAIDALEYSERWHAAALVRTCLRERWPQWID